MLGLRTPDKKPTVSQVTPGEDERAGPSTSPQTTKVRLSIDEWEATQKAQSSPVSPPKKPQTQLKLKLGSATVTKTRRPSAELQSGSSKPSREFPDRVTEARACIRKGKTALGESRNLRADLKADVTQALERLFQLVKEAEAAKAAPVTKLPVEETESARVGKCVDDLRDITWLRSALEEQSLIVKEGNQMMKQLRASLQEQGKAQELRDRGRHNDGDILEGIRTVQEITKETRNMVSEMKERAPTYAEALTAPQNIWGQKPKHSVIVSSDVTMDTSEVVVGRVKEVLDAKKRGLQIERVRKVKDQKVILSFNNREEMLKTTTQLKNDKHLKVEEAKNRDPLVIIKDLLAYNSDEEILKALRTQNPRLLEDLTAEEATATVRYRRKARNPLENHVVLQVAPKLWQRLTTAGRVFIDLQSVRVQDQSPLIQCTRCLAYGHGRKLCTESADLCNHCGGPHLKAECTGLVSGDGPTCRNCVKEKLDGVGHAVYSRECPVRRKWDALARAAIAYC